MNTNRFEYLSKDVPFLKKDGFLRLLFALAFFAIFIWQLTIFVISKMQATFTNSRLILTLFTMIASLFMLAMNVIYAIKSFGTMKAVKKDGKAVRNVNLMRSFKDKKFTSFYVFVSNALAWLMFLIFISALTYIVLEIVYHSSVPFYIPTILLITLTGFNSSYHIKTEVQIIRNIEKFTTLF